MAESPPLRYVARRLLANLAAGARLAFGAPVSLVSFRVSVPQFLALTLLLWVVAGLDDLINVGLDGRFNIFGLLQQVFFSLLFVLASLALARLYRHPHLALALPVLLAAGELPIDATHLLLSVADTGEFLSDEVKHGQPFGAADCRKPGGLYGQGQRGSTASGPAQDSCGNGVAPGGGVPPPERTYSARRRAYSSGVSCSNSVAPPSPHC